VQDRVETIESYLDRKYQELTLLNSCLASPLEVQKPASVGTAIDRKFRLAAAIKAERCLQSWPFTETAWSSTRPARSGPFEFSYGYQRADLHIHGPPIYPALWSPSTNVFQHTTYTGSGMSAMAALLTALSRQRGSVQVLVPQGCYSETRELIESFGGLFRILPLEAWRSPCRPRDGITRVALLDSSIPTGFFGFLRMPPHDIDLVIFDTTCLWRSSARIQRVVNWATRSMLPLALVRGHAKLDCLGIEYGRLGSVVVAAPLRGILSGRLGWITDLTRQTGDSVRLLGAAPIPANFPPFIGNSQFERCSVARIAAIIRNNRRMARLLSAELGPKVVSAFQHGLYLTLTPSGNLSIASAKQRAAVLCERLLSSALPVSHAGSFGFDFVAIEWFADSSSRRNVVRVAASDIPLALIDQIAEELAREWIGLELTMKRSSRAIRNSNTFA